MNKNEAIKEIEKCMLYYDIKAKDDVTKQQFIIDILQSLNLINK